MLKINAINFDQLNTLKGKVLAYNLIFVLFVVTVLALLVMPSYPLSWGDQRLALLTSLCIGFLSFFNLYFAALKRPFTLNCMHWTFILYFAFYAPLIQLMMKREPSTAAVGQMLKFNGYANEVILIWCIFYMIAYSAVSKRMGRKKTTVQADVPKQKVQLHSLSLALLCGACIVALLGTYLLMGPAGFGSRMNVNTSGADKISSLIVNSFLRYIPIAALAILLLSRTRKGMGYAITLAVTGISSIILDNFIAVPRYLFATIVIGFIAIFLRERKVTGLWLPISMFVGLAFIMPVLNIGRSGSIENLDTNRVQVRSYVDTFTTADFDAYLMLTNTLNYVDNRRGMKHGEQLLGTLLFFVPRQMWTNKPLATGEQVAKGYKLRFRNLSAPLMAEGYIDFGMVGVIFYALAFGGILAKTDFSYWQRKQSFFLEATYPFLFGLVFLNLRGSLMTTFAYACGYIAATWLISKAVVKRYSTVERVPSLSKASSLQSVASLQNP